MNYVELLEHSYIETVSSLECMPVSRLSFLGGHIFDVTTYDDSLDEFFGKTILDVCVAINSGKTFEYISDPERYRWYIAVTNLPFVSTRISWGTSIRSAWWDYRDCFDIHSCSLWQGDEQILVLPLDRDQWVRFVEDMQTFSQLTSESK